MRKFSDLLPTNVSFVFFLIFLKLLTSFLFWIQSKAEAEVFHLNTCVFCIFLCFCIVVFSFSDFVFVYFPETLSSIRAGSNSARRGFPTKDSKENDIDEPALEVHVGVLLAHLHVHSHLLGLLPLAAHLLPLPHLPAGHRFSVSDRIVQCSDQGHAKPRRGCQKYLHILTIEILTIKTEVQLILLLRYDSPGDLVLGDDRPCLRSPSCLRRCSLLAL